MRNSPDLHTVTVAQARLRGRVVGRFLRDAFAANHFARKAMTLPDPSRPNVSRFGRVLDHAAVITVVAVCGLIFQAVIETVSASPPVLWTLESDPVAAASSHWGLALVLVIWALALGFVLVLWLTHNHRDEGIAADSSVQSSPSQEARGNYESSDDDEDDDPQDRPPGMPGRWLIH